MISESESEAHTADKERENILFYFSILAVSGNKTKLI
jgi:hypothetical protein